MTEKDASMDKKGQTFNSFVSGTSMITLNKLTGSEKLSVLGGLDGPLVLMVMDVRIILLLRIQVFLKINILNGKN